MKNNLTAFLICVGGLLVLCSAFAKWGLFEQIREAYYHRKALSLYELEYPDKSNDFNHHGHIVKVADVDGENFIDSRSKWDDAMKPLEVRVDGKGFFLNPSPVPDLGARASEREPIVRYANAMRLSDLKTGKSYLAIIAGLGSSSDPDLWSFQILLIDKSGSVRKDSFQGKARNEPLYRKLLAQHASPPMGFRSQALVQWPTIWYPILYPWITTFLGVILCAGGLILRWRERKRNGGRQK